MGTAQEIDAHHQAEHQALGWLLGSLRIDHPGWLAEQADKADHYAETLDQSAGAAHDRTLAMVAVLREWAEHEARHGATA